MKTLLKWVQKKHLKFLLALVKAYQVVVKLFYKDLISFFESVCDSRLIFTVHTKRKRFFYNP